MFTQIQAPLYVLTWFAGILVFSGYRRPYHFSRAFRGIIAASIFLLLVYALLPMHLRFSRALILMGSLWALVVTATWRFLFLLVGGHAVPIYRKNRKRILIVAGSEEFRRIEDLVKLPGMTPRITGRVDPTGNGTDQDQLGTMQQLPELIHFYHIDEIIFSADDILMEEIIWQITRLAGHNVQFKIAPPESMGGIGSSSNYRSGDLYFQATHPVTSPGNRRTKRLLDILTSLLLILASPLYIIAMKHPKGFYRNAFQILKGKATWVGPRNLPRVSATSDPYLKPPVLSPAEVNPTTPNHPDLVRKVEMNYIQNYHYQTDLRIIMHSFSRLGQNPAGN